MREKLVDKQKAVDEHESNFTAGRVNVRERYLHRTGIRGRKSWIFCCVLFILTVIVVVNLVVSWWTILPYLPLSWELLNPFTHTISILDRSECTGSRENNYSLYCLPYMADMLHVN